jgi:RHS repeat-associated protein
LVSARTYTRDDLGRITEVVDYSDGATTIWGYGYDVFGRLETVAQDSAAYASYEYDANGNRLSRTSGAGVETGTYDAQDRLVTYAGADYGYTAAGELAERIEGADTTRYSYDVLGNLMEVELPDGTLIEYVIDGRNRRVGKKIDGDLVQGFLYGDQLNPVAELDSLGNVVSRFVYGSKANLPDYIIQGSDTLRVISDHLGSVRLVVNATTGSIAQKVSYDEWGRVLADSNPGFQPFGFAGGLWDADVGLVRFGARDYSAVEGRWTTKDPIGSSGGVNVYEYAAGDPVGLVDPAGLSPCLARALLAGTLVFGTTTPLSGPALVGLALGISAALALSQTDLAGNALERSRAGWRKIVGLIASMLSYNPNVQGGPAPPPGPPDDDPPPVAPVPPSGGGRGPEPLRPGGEYTLPDGSTIRILP